MMSTLLKLGLSGYDVKPRFGAFQCEYLLQNPLFLGENFGDTRHPYEKNELTLDHCGGGVHGKACWLIACVCCILLTVKCNNTVNSCSCYKKLTTTTYLTVHSAIVHRL